MNDEKQPLDCISLFGYKSIRELKTLHLQPGLNVLIGANGSGKSNFIRFFEMLGHMMDPNKGLQNYVASRGRADAFLFRGMKVTPQMEASLMISRLEYRFALRAADDRSLFFSYEAIPLHSSDATKVVSFPSSGHLESELGFQPHSSFYEWVGDMIRDWRVYHFHDTSASAPVMGLCNVVDNEILHGNAANLAAVLMHMQQVYPGHFARIVETVRQVAPFFGGFALREVAPGQTQLLWQDRYSDLLYYPHQLSDGTLRYICLATLLLQPNPAATLIIDEPELGLHPYAIKLLTSMLHEAAQRTQLIVATQSSLLVDELTPEQVIVVNHRDGESLLEHLEPERLKSWLEEYTLGQLWEKNELGGLP